MKTIGTKKTSKIQRCVHVGCENFADEDSWRCGIHDRVYYGNTTWGRLPVDTGSRTEKYISE